MSAVPASHPLLNRRRRREEPLNLIGNPSPPVFGQEGAGAPDPNSNLLQTLFMLTTAGIPIPNVQAVGGLPGAQPLSGPGVGPQSQGQGQPQAAAAAAGGLGSEQPPVPTVGGPTTAASIARLGTPQPITNPLRTRLRQ